jgi:hypothetical protein
MLDQAQLRRGNTRRLISSVNLQAVHCLSRYRMAWAPRYGDFRRLGQETRACAQLASIPILLIDLCWNDDADGSALRNEVDADPRELASSDALTQSLTRQMLFLVWHLAQVGDPRLCLIDPSRRYTQRVRELELGALDRFASAAAKGLRVRWAEEPHYWDALIDAACQGNDRELERLFVLGLQMMGAPLHARLIA